MPLSLDELIANAQITDDTKVPVPGGEITMGDLRKFTAMQKAAADEVLRRRQAELDAEFARTRKLSDDALALYESLKASPPIPEGKRGNEGEIDWDTDPVYSPVQKRLKTYEETIGKLTKQNEDLAKAIASGFSFVTDYVWEQGLNTLDKLSRPKDMNKEQLVKYAAENKIYDKWGLPDPVKAARQLTSEQRESAKLEEARKAGLAEGRRAAAASNLPRPGSALGAPRSAPPKPGEGPKSMRDLLQKAMADPEIQRVAGGVQE